MFRIETDVMGGDIAPGNVISGAEDALPCTEFGTEPVILETENALPRFAGISAQTPVILLL